MITLQQWMKEYRKLIIDMEVMSVNIVGINLSHGIFLTALFANTFTRPPPV